MFLCGAFSRCFASRMSRWAEALGTCLCCWYKSSFLNVLTSFQYLLHFSVTSIFTKRKFNSKLFSSQTILHPLTLHYAAESSPQIQSLLLHAH